MDDPRIREYDLLMLQGRRQLTFRQVGDSQTIFQAWPSLIDKQRQELMASVAGIWADIISSNFDAIGSLQADQRSTRGVSVGPMSFLAFECPEAAFPRNAGPFTSIREYFLAQISQDLYFDVPWPKPANLPLWRAAARRGVDELFPSADCPWALREGSRLVLNHIDFSPQNILVSKTQPTRVVSVIDWEGANVVPLFAVRPQWVWPNGVTDGEKATYNALMREIVAAKCPAWSEAMSEDFRPVRVMHVKTTLIAAEEKDMGLGKLAEFLMPIGTT